METLDSLALFGLSRQEGQIYLLLVAEGDLTGYEAAKQAGISRSNAYGALAALVAKGAAYLLDGGVPRYAALAPQEFFRHRIRSLEDAAQTLLASLPQRRTATEGYLTISGRTAVLDRMRSMVEGAELRIYFALPEPALQALLPALQAAAARGLRVTALAETRPNIPGVVFHASAPAEDQIRLIADSQEVLTGEWGPGESASCLYSRRPALVSLFKQALGNEIRLLELGESGRVE